MAGIPYCHDRADEPPDKEEYEKAMGAKIVYFGRGTKKR